MAEVSVPFDVFDPDEIARAAGADAEDVRALLASGRVPTIDGRFVCAAEAVAVVRSLRNVAPLPTFEPALFEGRPREERERGVPLAGSALVHGLMLGGFALLLSVGAASQQAIPRFETTRLVFLPLPGPGGGGGGGGLKQPTPPARAELKGSSRMRSPVPTREKLEGPKTDPSPARPEPPAPAPDPVEPPPPPQEPDPAPPVVAPVATVAADTRDNAGLPDDRPAAAESHGPGAESGRGSGTGTGAGEGEGAGIGPGSGGGTGGGPYRPGSGITPPSLLREVKPDYTEDARRRGINGEVELEIVVRSDGTVGDVRLVRGLGAGLDQRAIDAVRQWRFAPARRFGTPVDVLVQIAVEFRIR
jgi:TonB family protein